jgi:hypothetical protein
MATISCAECKSFITDGSKIKEEIARENKWQTGMLGIYICPHCRKIRLLKIILIKVSKFYIIGK